MELVKLEFKDLKKKERKMIKDIVHNFNFDRVNKVMELLDWKWYTTECPNGKIPSVPDMISICLQYLKRGISETKDHYLNTGEKDYSISTGGFEYYFELNEEDKIDYVSMKFVLTEWESFREDAF